MVRPPPSFWMARISWNMGPSAALTTTPPVTSPCPPRYLVEEWTARSAPSSRQRCRTGVAQVLSQTQASPRSWASCATWAMSVILSSGLDGVSTRMSLVAGVIASLTASMSVMSTKEVCRPHLTRRSRSSSAVPWYRSCGAIRWSPVARDWNTAARAAAPEENAAASAPPSRSLTHSSRSDRVGLPERLYTKPSGYEPSGSRSKVVDMCIGGVTAPVAGSTLRPL